MTQNIKGSKHGRLVVTVGVLTVPHPFKGKRQVSARQEVCHNNINMSAPNAVTTA